ncbi:MAG: hypothetical protein CFE31_14985 [Rhizobiales bacterium PAR1]|nr:MAG: hypothetical protein CFE31_14985 [Rhizobiales bacterium PAR1]
MSFSFIIEIGEDAVGLVHRASELEPYRFFASDQRLSALDGATFWQPRQAETAARTVLRGGGARRKNSLEKSHGNVLFGEHTLPLQTAG